MTEMSWTRYQCEVRLLARYPDALSGKSTEIAYLGLGLAGEAGETVDTLKKILRRGLDVRTTPEELRAKLVQELGDVFWYLASILDVFELRLEDVLSANLEKLHAREELGTLATHYTPAAKD